MSNILPSDFEIVNSTNELTIHAGILLKKLMFNTQGIIPYLSINNTSILGSESEEFSFLLAQASPNAMPPQLAIDQGGEITQANADANGTDGLKIDQHVLQSETTRIEWINPITIHSHDICTQFKTPLITQESSSRYQITWKDSLLHQHQGIEISVIYEIYPNLPVIRKWITITNRSEQWKRVDNLLVDGGDVTQNLPKRIDLTPSERGACACMIAFTHSSDQFGVILGSEIPSALRTISPDGSMGYTPQLFEWVLGPGEIFTSEPIFYLAFHGNIQKYGKYRSTPLERTVEQELKIFIEMILKIHAATVPLPGPVWCTWSNFVANINDTVIREQALLAAECGFNTFQIDAGWALSEVPSDWTAGGSEVHPEKFPRFAETSQIIYKNGLKLGLWLSCFRSLHSKDMQELPHTRSVPLIKRGQCYGMSFASVWRDYYSKDVVRLVEQFHTTYFKQDLTNPKFGDISVGHESRTLKESYLRGLRGLLTSQANIHAMAPNVWTLLSHEIYWGTPGVPCDLAALKGTCAFHIPPNDYSGCGIRRERWNPAWKNSWGAKTWELRMGCLHARHRYYAHRGLPLYAIEYYGAATVNIQGSLTAQIQDRQICSWIMGALSVFAGDLSSLSLDNRAHYRKRFDMVKKIEATHNILRYCQFSGVPPPTEKGWHWFGKINTQGTGVVVVLRGWGGSSKKRIWIPWVDSNKRYHIIQLFTNTDLGFFNGKELQEIGVFIHLPRWGQDILEVQII